MPIEISGPPLPPPDRLPVRPDALEVYDALPVEPEVWAIPLRRGRAGGAEIAEAPHPAPTSVETMRVTFRGIDFRLTLRVFLEQRRASCCVEVLRDGRWEELAGLNVRENEMKFHRGIEWLHSYAYEHGRAE